MSYPEHRPRRMRRTAGLRRLLRETRLSPDQLIQPLFVKEQGDSEDIPAMPGQRRYALDDLIHETTELSERGVQAVLLFGIPAAKDEKGRSAYSEIGIVQKSLRALRDAMGENIVLITDVCLCQYTTHGHCGILSEDHVDNDLTTQLLGKTAVSHAQAGADIVAPSAMMDGQVAAIRRKLDKAGFENTGIMSYSAKFASAFYGPFREAADSSPSFGDRLGYQMDTGNAREALREVALDVEEGADIVMVKPALPYLDIIHRIKNRFYIPVAAYQVSGEYAMIKTAAQKETIDERSAVLESMTAMKRAGADLIISYFSKEAVEWMDEA